MITIRKTLFVVGLLVLAACGGNMRTTAEPSEKLPSLNDVTDAQWTALSKRRIFFGHQSVGQNIVDGLNEVMAANPRVRLNIVESRDLTNLSRAGFHHAKVGRNDFPIEKFDDFVQLASAGFGADGGVAMLKLCYVDIHRQTDAGSLFSEYQGRIARLKDRNPAITVVHFTSPLTTIENWKGQLRAVLTGNATQRQRNVIRHRYNELLRQAYVGKEPVFDIARLEAMQPDGRSAFYRAGDADIPLLLPTYTDDGGHLNAGARRLVAEQLLITLARLDTAAAGANRVAVRR